MIYIISLNAYRVHLTVRTLLIIYILMCVLLIVRNKIKESKELLYSEKINLKATTTEEKNRILMKL